MFTFTGKAPVGQYYIYLMAEDHIPVPKWKQSKVALSAMSAVPVHLSLTGETLHKIWQQKQCHCIFNSLQVHPRQGSICVNSRTEVAKVFTLSKSTESHSFISVKVRKYTFWWKRLYSFRSSYSTILYYAVSHRWMFTLFITINHVIFYIVIFLCTENILSSDLKAEVLIISI